MRHIDEQIELELLLDNYNYNSLKNMRKSLRDILIKIGPLINLQVLNKLLKQKITEIYDIFGEELVEDIIKQSNLMLKKNDIQDIDADAINVAIKTDLKTEELFGYTFQRAIKQQNRNIQQAVELLIKQHSIKGIGEKSSKNSFIKGLKQIFKNSSKVKAKTIARTYAKFIREKTNDEIDKRYKGQIGWVSLATLDSRTSSVCIKYDKTFYDIKQYKSRLDIPDRPPRHFNCRSILIRVSQNTLNKIRPSVGDNGAKQVYGKTDFDSFLKRNPKTAKKLMGSQKYNLYLQLEKEKKISIRDFINDDGRYFTNEEIMEFYELK